LIIAANALLLEHSWPLPFFLLGSSALQYLLIIALSSEVIIRRLTRRKDAETPHELNRTIERFFRLAIRFKLRDIQSYWLSHPLLKDKEDLVYEIFLAYRNSLWLTMSQCSLPIADRVVRDATGNPNLGYGFGHALKELKKQGVETDSFESSEAISRFLNNSNLGPESNSDLRLIGPALRSFLELGESFFQDNYNEKTAVSVNRHAFAHCGDHSPVNQEHAMKILTFVDLALRLHEPLRILLAKSKNLEE